MKDLHANRGLDALEGSALAPFLTRSPADLTLLAKTSGGVLPMSRLHDAIDGADLPGHGSREMPERGHDGRVKEAGYLMDAPCNAEAYVSALILGLLEHIHRTQAK